MCELFAIRGSHPLKCWADIREESPFHYLIRLVYDISVPVHFNCLFQLLVSTANKSEFLIFHLRDANKLSCIPDYLFRTSLIFILVDAQDALRG